MFIVSSDFSNGLLLYYYYVDSALTHFQRGQAGVDNVGFSSANPYEDVPLHDIHCPKRERRS
jgi:hypothetical protein